MFEYLMPRLFLPSYENTLLDQACQGAVSRQIDYGRQRHVPWGISESCYNAVDMNQIYQYRAFGVPGLGFKRGLAEDLVDRSLRDCARADGGPSRRVPKPAGPRRRRLSGRLRHCTKPSTTPRRALLPGTDHAVVRCFMAHHQGMSLLALATCAARWAHAASLPLRPAGPHHRVAAARTRAEAHGHRAPARGRGGRGRTRRCHGSGRRPSRVRRPEHAPARGPPAVERPLPRHGHPRGWGLQPLARSGGDPLARGRDL